MLAPTGGQFSLWSKDNLHTMHTDMWPFLNTLIMNVNIYSWNTEHFQAIIFAYGTSVNFQHISWRLTVQCLTHFFLL